MRARPRLRGATRIVAVAAAAVAIVVGGAAAAVGVGRAGTGSSPKSTLPPATATVTRQTLLDSETTDGTLAYGKETTVAGKLRGTVTWLPESGSVVKRGQPLYRVDNTPVLLLYGTLPAYRDLAPGAEGADVRQFEQELRALGYTGFTVDDTYNAATAAAVKKWQKANGLPRTGTVELGRVVFAPAEVRIGTVKAEVGSEAGDGILTYTGTARVVTVKLKVSDQRLARQGAKVSVILPNGQTAEGTIARVASIVESGEGGGEETKIEVTVALTDQAAVSGFDRASVDVRFTVAERRGVLTVPVAALLALAEGGYGVQVVEGSTTRIVRVETGLFSGGRVEITGAGITEGTTVGVPT